MTERTNTYPSLRAHDVTERSMRIREVWYVPVLFAPPLKRPSVHYDFRSRLKKFAIQNATTNCYRGGHDWNYMRRLGWRIVKMTMTGKM